MTHRDNSPGADTVDAVLEGGPRDLPTRFRTARISADRRKIKVPHRGGYEHFERDQESITCPTQPHLIFRWTDRTAMAE